MVVQLESRQHFLNNVLNFLATLSATFAHGFPFLELHWRFQKTKWNLLLTSLSPKRSTRQCRNPVWPTVTVKLRGTSKSKYGSRFDGETVLVVVVGGVGAIAAL